MDVTLVSSLKFNWLSARTEGGILKTKEGRMLWELIKFSVTGHSALKPVTSSGGSFKTLRIVYFWVVVWKSSSGELSGVIAVQSSRRQLPSRSVACALESLVCAPSWKRCDRGVSLCRRDREVWQLRGSPNPSKWVTVIVFCVPVARTRSPGWPWYWAHDRLFGPPWHSHTLKCRGSGL